MNDRTNSLRTLFIEAVEITDAAERAVFLGRACGDDDALRQRVERLLKAHTEAGGFTSAEGQTNVILPVTERPGDRIGRYKLREQIGEGGCGVVYVAEQEEPVRRRVALKVIKLGMDTKQVIARFEAERQALALMDHPNIARVLDAGATDTGRPYFVMELVRGIKITDYCDQNTLSTRERLDLFIQVCRAIQHAHQKGIIHRDIKPSNILVALHDGQPVPKVIDFGIAKATEGRLTDLTVHTELHQFIGTPAYMSPEQAEMSGLDIDTRSDIYSLGVLLYELLTGRTPFDAKTLLQAGLDQMRRIIREQEPVKPSTRLSTLTDVDLTEVARHRKVEAPKLIHVVRGDLDWIVMKSLEKDRTRRYDTANGLAMDIQRHLQSEPVLARPPSTGYRLRKLIRRNKLAFAAASVVALALVLGVLASMWQALRAETQAARSQQVAQFMQDMLKGVGPSAALGRDTAMLREILDKTAQRIAEDLKSQPEVEAELRNTIGSVYLELGDSGKAYAMHSQALAIRRKLFGNEHPDVATSLHHLAEALRMQRMLTEAEAAFRESLTIRRRLLGNEHPDVAQSLNYLGSLLSIELKDDEPEKLLREAIAIRRKVLGNEHGDVGASLDNLAHVLNRRGKVSEAIAMHEEALAIRKKFFGGQHPELAYSYVNLADAHLSQGKFAEAEVMLRAAESLRKKLFGNEHSEVAVTLHRLAGVLRAQGKSLDAEKALREALAIQRERSDNTRPDLADTLHELANLLHDQQKLSEAEPMYREALNLRRDLHGPQHRQVASSLIGLTFLLTKLPERQAEAEAMCREALVVLETLGTDGSSDRAFSLDILAGLMESKGNLAEAEAALREVLTIRRKLLGNEHRVVDDTLGNLVRVLQVQGKLAEAEAAHREELQLEKKLSGEEHPFVANSLDRLASLLREQSKLVEAESVIRESLAMRRKLQVHDDPNLAATLAELTSILLAEEKFVEAESPARECLGIREAKLPGDWRTFNARALLGRALLGQKKFAEAEPLLLAGYEGMKERGNKIPANARPRLKEALQSLVQFYEATNRPDKVAEWNGKLAE